jgi:hypothetical protein
VPESAPVEPEAEPVSALEQSEEAQTAEGGAQDAAGEAVNDEGVSDEQAGYAREAEPEDPGLDAEEPLAGGQTLASLAGKVSSFSEEPPADEERLSELERAVYEAAHAHDDGSDQDESWSEAQDGELSSGEASFAADTDATRELPRGLLAPREVDPDHANAHEPEGEAETADASEGEPPAEAGSAHDEHTAGANASDATLFDSVDVPIDHGDEVEIEQRAEEETSANLDSLDSLLQAPATSARGTGTSRIPPPPPAGRASTPAPQGTRNGAPSPPKSIRPPPPPRRD